MTSLIEQAFELARSGRFRSVAEIERRLSRDGFSFAEIQGQIGPPLIRRQVAQQCRTAAAQSAGSKSAA